MDELTCCLFTSKNLSWPLVALLAPIHSARAVDPVWEPAPRADDFVDSIGVCTHWSYENTPYAKAYDLVKQHLAESGIRHVRDAFYFREVELWHAYGIRDTVGSEPWRHDFPMQMKSWKANPGLIDMIEGPNEPNNFWPPFNGAERSKLRGILGGPGYLLPGSPKATGSDSGP